MASTGTLREVDQEETSFAIEAPTTDAEATRPDLKTSRETTQGVTLAEAKNLKRRCTEKVIKVAADMVATEATVVAVDTETAVTEMKVVTEIVVASVTEVVIVATVAAVVEVSTAADQRFLQLLRASNQTYSPIISASRQITSKV